MNALDELKRKEAQRKEELRKAANGRVVTLKPPADRLAVARARADKDLKNWPTIETLEVGPKPEIALGARDSVGIGEAARAALEKLVVRKVEIYQRAGRLVQPVKTSVVHVERGTIEITKLVEMDAVAMKAVLMREFNFTRKSADGGKREGVDPKFEIPKLILADRPQWRFPEVAGLLAAPTLRPDGTLLRAEGYDPATQMLLKNLPPLPPIKANPSRADAEAALATLKDLLEEFPFVDEPSRTVALSLIISVMVRAALDQVPLHVIAAPSAGSGKSFLADIASMVATGRTAAVVAATRDAEELDKRIGAELIAGRPLVSLDNVNGPLSSDLLCQSCTQDTVSLRPLGASITREISNRAVVVANGINIQPADDLTRRTLFARLDAGIERPWEHRYQRNPVEMIAADRGKYIAAALTIALAYLAAGEPEVKTGAVNGFKRWSRFVQAPLVWLGEADPVSTMAVARDGDPRLQVRVAILASMASLFGTGQEKGCTAAQIIETVSPKSLDAKLDAQMALLDQRKALREALMLAAGAGKEISPEKLGCWLRASKGQIVGGLRLRGELDRTKVMHWWIEEVEGTGE